jgi:hypothetical protein
MSGIRIESLRGVEKGGRSRMPQSTRAGARAARGARVPSTRSRSGRVPRPSTSSIKYDMYVARLGLADSLGVVSARSVSLGACRVPGVDAGARDRAHLGTFVVCGYVRNSNRIVGSRAICSGTDLLLY